MKLLADKNWNVALCGAMTSLRHGGTWLLLPNLSVSPNNPDAGGLRISSGWLLWYLWLDVAWWKWRKLAGAAQPGDDNHAKKERQEP